MIQSSLAELIQRLNAAHIRYMTVGGLAVSAHGFLRMTVDVDMILALDGQNLTAAIAILKDMGYLPKVPVSLDDVADPAHRAEWAVRTMQVLGLRSERHRETDVDIFLADPLGFDAAYQRVLWFDIGGPDKLPVCSYDDLVALKRIAGRPKDLADLLQLEKARQRP